MSKLKIKRVICLSLLVLTLFTGSCVHVNRQPNLGKVLLPLSKRKGKTPLIIVPGILGSRLKDNNTGREVWPRQDHSIDDLDLPVSIDLKNDKDNLVATEVVDRAKLGLFIPEIGVYEDLVEALTKYAGYKPGDIDNPLPGGDQDTFYLFSYDWRRDNVESAQLLAKKIDELKKKLDKPNLQFNLICHSMGGLIGRYYIMYGDADVLGNSDARITWAGARNINKFLMVGTPNEGSMDALRTLVEGYSLYGGDRKRIGFLTKIDAQTAFTMPAAFQLLPHPGTQQFYDSRMETIDADIFDAATWKKMEWSIYDRGYRKYIDKHMRKKYGIDAAKMIEQFFSSREEFLKVVLKRAHEFDDALDRRPTLKIAMKSFVFAGDCEATLRAPVVIDTKKGIVTIFQSRKLTFSGTTLKRKQVEAQMFEPGDGRVTRTSALGTRHDNASNDGLFDSSLNIFYAVFGCEIHGDLPNNPTFQDNLLSILLNDTVEDNRAVP